MNTNLAKFQYHNFLRFSKIASFCVICCAFVKEKRSTNRSIINIFSILGRSFHNLVAATGKPPNPNNSIQTIDGRKKMSLGDDVAPECPPVCPQLGKS